MVEISVGCSTSDRSRVVAVRQMSRLDSYPGHPIPFNQVHDGVQNFDRDVGRRQGELKAANTGSCATVRQMALVSTKRRHESEGALDQENGCLVRVLTVVNMMAEKVNPRKGNKAA